jgi:sugar/nucleoside kinase (ribokinase family)
MCVDLIVSGRDVIPQFGQVEKLVEDYTLEMGGSCCIFACQAARMGLRTAILGKVGADSFGELAVARLRQAGVNTDWVMTDAAFKTGLGIALCPHDARGAHDRAILTYAGTIDALTPADVTDTRLNSARHLHHGSYYLQTSLRPGMANIFHRARALGLTTSLDTNWDPVDEWADDLRALLPLVDILMPNEQEALRIAGVTTLDACLPQLHRLGARLVVIKRGAQGALVSDGQQMWQQSVQPVTGGDSIGAGDSFDAGFLAGWLRGLPLPACLQVGCACGRAVAAAIGGLQGQPTWGAIKE